MALFRNFYRCARCGHEWTDEWSATCDDDCPHCGAHHFPRTDPCVIMTVEHDGRLLLGRRAGWPPGRLSVLAGFVSPGESAEEAVVREVFEESGIVARDPVFVASQPCVLCGRTPSHAHHIRFAQPRAMGAKVSDEFTVPLCFLHHRSLHDSGAEETWWQVHRPIRSSRRSDFGN